MKILLLTDVPPSDKFSGTLMTKHLCEMLPNEEIVCFSVINRDLAFLKQDVETKKRETAFSNKPRESGYRIPWISYFKEEYVRKFVVPRLVEEAAIFARKHNVDRIWAILQGQTIIRMSVALADKLKLPLYTQVWDHPAWWVKAHGLDVMSGRKIVADFDRAIRSSRCCAAASHVMARDFSEQHGIKTIPIIASIKQTLIKPIKKFSLKDKKEIVIGMAGQLYAHAEWQALLTMLNQLDWEINGKPIRVRYLGYSITLGGHNKACVEYLGYRTQQETIDILADCDVLYCPYFFDKEHELIARTSFPSKLTSYLAAGKPVFFHGPDYAAPAIFLKEKNAGCICSSLSSEVMSEKMKALLANEDAASQMISNGYDALKREFTMDALRENFMQFINV